MNYEDFYEKVRELYPMYLDRSQYVYKSDGSDRVAILKLTDKKIQETYIANIDRAEYTSKSLILKVVFNKFDPTFQYQHVNGGKHKVNNLIAETKYYKSLENVFYDGLSHIPNFTGKSQSWHPNGNIKKTGDYFGGLKNGHWTTYYDNGQKHISGNYVNGKKTGKFTEWSKVGPVFREMNFKDDLHHGTYIVWHPNGNKKKESRYINGKKSGSKICWDANGNETKTVMYSNKSQIVECY